MYDFPLVLLTLYLPDLFQNKFDKYSANVDCHCNVQHYSHDVAQTENVKNISRMVCVQIKAVFDLVSITLKPKIMRRDIN